MIEDQMELWKQYKTGDKNALPQLLDSLKPLMIKETMRWGAFNIPRSVLMTEAKLNVIKALDTYNPSMAALSTHVVHNLRKVSRTAYKYGMPVFVPERRQTKLGLFKNVYADLQAQYNREPSVQEISEEIKWSPKEVSSALREVQGTAFINPEKFPDVSYTPHTNQESMIRYVYEDLSDEGKVVLERMTGMHGKEPCKSLLQISKVTDIPYHTVRKVKDEIINKLQEGRDLFTTY